MKSTDLKFLWLSECIVAGRTTNPMNLPMVCPVFSEVSFEYGKDLLSPILFVYKVPPVNFLTDLTPNF